MTILSVSNILVEYGTDIILQNIGFSINEGDRLGIVGVNGAGKSTLLHIIAGTKEPSSGAVYIAKGKTVAMLEQNAMLESDKTLFEEMADAFPECRRIEEKLAALHAEIEEETNAHNENYQKKVAEFSSLTEMFGSIGGYEVLKAEKVGKEIFYTLPDAHTLKAGDTVDVVINEEIKKPSL